jgi:hypothetical protein
MFRQNFIDNVVRVLDGTLQGTGVKTNQFIPQVRPSAVTVSYLGNTPL